MRARAAANQLTLALRAALPKEEWFPVKPLAIAQQLQIRVLHEDLGALEGAMLCAGKKSAIVINTRIQDEGRRNFTAGHELGHYSLHKDRKELRCSAEDLLDVAAHPANIEQEANEFAMTLLMPADDVRMQVTSAPLSIGRIAQIAARYGTSLTATALRVREIADRSAAIAIAFEQHGLLKWWWPTQKFVWRPPRGSLWPSSISLSQQPRNVSTESTFGRAARARLGETLTVSGIDMPSYQARLWCVETPDPRRSWEIDRDEDGDVIR